MTVAVQFLIGAAALAALGALGVWIASRPRRERFGSTINSFSNDLNALAPPGQRRPQRDMRRRPVSTGARRPAAPEASPGPRPKPGPRQRQQPPAS